MAVPLLAQNQADSPAGERLQRIIGPWSLGTNAVNIGIGAGVFVMPALVAAILGPAAMIAYFICGLAMAMVLTCFIEIGTLVSRSGGAVAYVEEAFGPLMGFLAWLVYSVGGFVVASAALGNALLDTTASVAPAMGHGAARIVALAVLFGGLAAVNIAGIRQGMRVAVAMTIAKLLPLVFVIAAGALAMHWRELHWTGWPSAAKLGEASLLLFFAFLGTEGALIPSGEISDPARTIPRAMFGATIVIILLYVSLQVISQGVLGDQLAKEGAAPLASVAARIIGTAGRNLILMGVAISILGSLAGAMVGTPRAFFLAAQDGMLPARLAAVHPRFRTPHVAIATVAIMMFLLAASGAFKPLAVLASVSILSVYLAICLGALRLRYTRERKPNAFRAPGGPLVSVLGSATVLWMLGHSTRVEAAEFAITLVVATAYYVFRSRRLSHRAVNSRALGN